MKRLIEEVSYLQEVKARRTKGFLNHRSWVYQDAKPTVEEKETLKRLIKANPSKYIFRENEETYKFWYSLSGNGITGSWTNAHFHQDDHADKFGVDKKDSIKGRLVDDPVLTWLFIYSPNEYSLSAGILNGIKTELMHETGRHVELIVDDHGRVLEESKHQLKEFFEQKDYLEYAKCVHPRTFETWIKSLDNVNESKNTQLYNEYWRMRLLDRGMHGEFLDYNNDRIDEKFSSFKFTWESFLKQDKLRESSDKRAITKRIEALSREIEAIKGSSKFNPKATEEIEVLEYEIGILKGMLNGT